MIDKIILDEHYSPEEDEVGYSEAPDGVSSSFTYKVRRCKKCGCKVPNANVKLWYHAQYNCHKEDK